MTHTLRLILRQKDSLWIFAFVSIWFLSSRIATARPFVRASRVQRTIRTGGLCHNHFVYHEPLILPKLLQLPFPRALHDYHSLKIDY